MTATTNMDLTLGVVGAGGDTQETWGNIINENARTVDAHNHTSGAGVKIPSAGININADLSANNYQLTGLKTTAYATEVSSLSSSFKSCVYVVAGNLYFNNGAGSAVQVTTGSAVNVGSTGTISGMTGTASVAFDGTTTFAFSRSSGVYANLASSGCQLFFTTVGAANGLTLGVQANLPTAYSVLFPIQTPNAAGGDIFPELDTSGNITWRKSIINDGSNTVGKVAYFTDAKTLSSIALGAGQLLIGTSTSTAPSAAALTGTANQVTVTLGSGTVTLALPQNIHSLATPTFAGLTLSGAFVLASTAVIAGAVTMSNLTASRAVVTDGSKVLASLEYTSANTVNTLVQRGASGQIAIGALTATTGAFSSTLTVADNATFSSSVSVDGALLAAANNVTIGGTLGVTGATTLTALSATTGTFSSTLNATGAATLGSTLGVVGASTLAALSATTGVFSSTLAVNDVATFASGVVASATFSVAGASTLAALSATTGAFSSTLAVTGASTLAALSATTGAFSSTLSATGAVNFASLNASQVVTTDGSKNLSSLAFAVGNTAGALVQRSGAGDFSANTVTLAADLTAAGTVTANLVDTTLGISTGGNGSASRIKWKVFSGSFSALGEYVKFTVSGTVVGHVGRYLAAAGYTNIRDAGSGATVQWQSAAGDALTEVSIFNNTPFSTFAYYAVVYYI